MLPLKGNPFDLHVLSTPPAFVLSQDQTLHRNRVQQLPAESIIFEELVLTRVGKFQLAHEQTELLVYFKCIQYIWRFAHAKLTALAFSFLCLVFKELHFAHSTF